MTACSRDCVLNCSMFGERARMRRPTACRTRAGSRNDSHSVGAIPGNMRSEAVTHKRRLWRATPIYTAGNEARGPECSSIIARAFQQSIITGIDSGQPNRTGAAC